MNSSQRLPRSAGLQPTTRGDRLPACRSCPPVAKATSVYGVAATASPPATEAAVAMLRAGGNAVDAAASAAWALAVCEPGNSGLGGQTIMLIRLSHAVADRLEAGPVIVLDGHSRAPVAVLLETVSHDEQRIGHRATTVPSTPLVLETARQRYGRLSLAQVIEPAIRLAEEGYPVTRLHRRQLGWCLTSMRASPSASRLFLKHGRPLEVGELFRQPELAATLQRIARHGVDDFYRGQIARQIAADMQRHGGLLTLDDLAAIESPVEREPISITYRGEAVVTVPPPAGGVQVLLALKLLERLSIHGPNGDLCHWYEMLGEVTYTVFRERERTVLSADRITPDALQELLSDERAELLAAEVDGVVRSRRLVEPRADNLGIREAEEPGETTHLCTADAEGNVVSLTQSIQSLFGARVACEPCGFLYNNYLVTCPRGPHPHQLASRCLPRSNAAPTLLIRGVDLQPALPGWTTSPRSRSSRLAPRAEVSARGESGLHLIALGAAGSRRTTSAIVHTISGVVDRRLSLAEAVDVPRIHVKLSRKAWMEHSPETEPLVVRLAERFRGVQRRSRHSYAMGCVQAIRINSDGMMSGAVDPRREGMAMVLERQATHE